MAADITRQIIAAGFLAGIRISLVAPCHQESISVLIHVAQGLQRMWIEHVRRLLDKTSSMLVSKNSLLANHEPCTHHLEIKIVFLLKISAILKSVSSGGYREYKARSKGPGWPGPTRTHKNGTWPPSMYPFSC
jgi:hypothetical protein